MSGGEAASSPPDSGHKIMHTEKKLFALLDHLAERWNRKRRITLDDLRSLEERLTNLILGRHRPKRVRFDWGVGLVSTKTRTDTTRMPLKVKITNEQKIKVSLTPVTDGGKPAKLDGKPSFEVVAGDCTVEVADDGLSATIISSDNPGQSQVLVKADADIGEGVEEISDVIEVEVGGAAAKNLGLTAGTPELK